MRVKDIMAKDVIFATPETKVVEVADMLFKHGFHGLPIVENGKLVGIITENDFFIKDSGVLFLPSYINLLKETQIADDLPQEKKKKIRTILNLEAKDIMTRDVVSVSPEMEVNEVLDLMKKTRFNTLPVTNGYDNILLGIITLVDVIGMVKQSREGTYLGKARDAEELVRDVHSWSKKTLVFISKFRIRSWKFIFATAFIAGAIAAIIWTVSIRIQNQSGATEKSARIYLAADDNQISEEKLFNVDILLDTDGQRVNMVNTVINYDPDEFALEIWDYDKSAFSTNSNCQYEKKPCQSVKNNPEKGQIEIDQAAPGGIKANNEKIGNLVFRARRSPVEKFPVSQNITIDEGESGIYVRKGFFSKDNNEDNILTSVSGVNINVIHPEFPQ